MDPIRNNLSESLSKLLDVPADQVAQTMARPPKPELGEFALPVFRWAKAKKTSPPALAEELAKKAQTLPLVHSAVAQGPYVNFILSAEEMGSLVAQPVLDAPDSVAKSKPNSKTIVIDFSSPNVAKPFHIGHLNTTVLGNALVRILRHQGYTVEGINHLGDWGTQFGKSAVAWKKWGSQEELEQADQNGEGARYLVKLYVQFHEEAEKPGGEALEDQAREWFRLLEEGDEEHRKLWQTFIDVSLREFERVYDLLNVKFDHFTGESFYNDKMEAAIERLEKANLLVESEGAQIVEMGEKNPPFLVRKSDGATLYGTRDLAAAFYRLETFQPESILYVVGAPQKLHFKQLFTVLGKLDPTLPQHFEHISFGHTRFKNRSIKTRKGDVVYLEDVLAEAKTKVLEKIEENIAEKGNYLTEDKNVVAAKLAASCLVFGYLRVDSAKDVTFDWDTAFELQGDTGPGVQYGHAQLRSILRKSGAIEGTPDWGLLKDLDERQLLSMIGRFHDAIDQAAAQRKPHQIATLLLEIRQQVNRYLRREDLPKIKDLEGPLRTARLSLVLAIAEVLRTGLELLGLEATEQM